jgi:hypothetical protein
LSISEETSMELSLPPLKFLKCSCHCSRSWRFYQDRDVAFIIFIRWWRVNSQDLGELGRYIRISVTSWESLQPNQANQMPQRMVLMLMNFLATTYKPEIQASIVLPMTPGCKWKAAWWAREGVERLSCEKRSLIISIKLRYSGKGIRRNQLFVEVPVQDRRSRATVDSCRISYRKRFDNVKVRSLAPDILN